MNLRAFNEKGVAFRTAIAAGTFAAFLFALILSATPRLHDHFHGATNPEKHECAATLLASGNYQHTPTIAISLAPPPSPKQFLQALRNCPLVIAHLDFSLLEHAPPSLSQAQTRR